MVTRVREAQFSKRSLVATERGRQVRCGTGRIIGSHINPAGTMEVTCSDEEINKYLEIRFHLLHMLLLVMWESLSNMHICWRGFN